MSMTPATSGTVRNLKGFWESQNLKPEENQPPLKNVITSPNPTSPRAPNRALPKTPSQKNTLTPTTAESKPQAPTPTPPVQTGEKPVPPLSLSALTLNDHTPSFPQDSSSRKFSLATPRRDRVAPKPMLNASRKPNVSNPGDTPPPLVHNTPPGGTGTTMVKNEENETNPSFLLEECNALLSTLGASSQDPKNTTIGISPAIVSPPSDLPPPPYMPPPSPQPPPCEAQNNPVIVERDDFFEAVASMIPEQKSTKIPALNLTEDPDLQEISSKKTNRNTLSPRGLRDFSSKFTDQMKEKSAKKREEKTDTTSTNRKKSTEKEEKSKKSSSGTRKSMKASVTPRGKRNPHTFSINTDGSSTLETPRGKKEGFHILSSSHLHVTEKKLKSSKKTSKIEQEEKGKNASIPKEENEKNPSSPPLSPREKGKSHMSRIIKTTPKHGSKPKGSSSEKGDAITPNAPEKN